MKQVGILKKNNQIYICLCKPYFLKYAWNFTVFSILLHYWPRRGCDRLFREKLFLTFKLMMISIDFPTRLWTFCGKLVTLFPWSFSLSINIYHAALFV
ncbi:hypothetical protein T12_224 [Trichinella patagoniensis]|uniref:Uncharacterized protein n=1 Tax=Trichinella patagoniensis TaxID=990121 RepID=A0A0V1A2E1_9BILA|nr:hypothetical protein T12_224 [Trichinella patagoniensis]